MRAKPARARESMAKNRKELPQSTERARIISQVRVSMVWGMGAG